MLTFFLRKKGVCYTTWGLSVLFTVSVMLYSVMLSQTRIVDVRTAFYFLVAEETHVEAGAEFVKLEGGAGYLLTYDGKDYAVFSVYLKEEDGLAVQAALSESGRAAQLLPIFIDCLFFKGADRKKENIYLSALNCLKEYAQVFAACASYLEKGIPQERIKRILIPAQQQLLTLSKSYKKKFGAFSKLCKRLSGQLAVYNSDILYARDLRYLLCSTSVGYLELCKRFAL